jgi:hypothetical protein
MHCALPPVRCLQIQGLCWNVQSSQKDSKDLASVALSVHRMRNGKRKRYEKPLHSRLITLSCTRRSIVISACLHQSSNRSSQSHRIQRDYGFAHSPSCLCSAERSDRTQNTGIAVLFPTGSSRLPTRAPRPIWLRAADVHHDMANSG